MYSSFLDTPVGWLKIEANENYITSIKFLSPNTNENLKTNDLIKQCEEELLAYFDGYLQHFNVPISFEKGTLFQQKVWNELKKIPYGKCVSYKDIAQKIQNPKAVRAVGGANNKNPLPIIVPCHRVIGVNKKLVGYAGGLERKEFLLKLEGYM